MEQKIRKLKGMISEANTISVLTGAGISTESGIPDFRSTKGLWTEDVSRIDVISRDYFEREPELFWKYFKDIFQIKLSHSYEPNSGHLLLKELERNGKDIRIFTQNVDGLHHKAGSGKVYELHGSILFADCPECGKEHHLHYINEQAVPLCSDEECKQILKPDVVLFGDMVRYFEEMYESISESDLFLVIGTSLEVFPVSQVPLDFRNKATLGMVLINAEPTRLDPVFDLVIHGKSGAVAKALAE